MQEEENEAEQETANEGTKAGETSRNQPNYDPTSMYENLEDSMRKRRLERPEVRRMALMHVARWCMPEGERIRYPIPDSMIRLLLAAENIPTEPNELLELIYRAYEDRGIVFSLTDTIKDLAKIHGHRAFDPTESWSKCHVDTHAPIHVATKTPRTSRLRRPTGEDSAARTNSQDKAQTPHLGNERRGGPFGTLSTPSADGPGPSLWERIRRWRKLLRKHLRRIIEPNQE